MENKNNLSSALKSVFTGDAILKYSKKNRALLFILPLVYGVLAWVFYREGGTFFATYPDSTYIYLINGINIASGNFNLGHYDNPGTTAHWLSGIVLFFTHLFFGNGNIIEDILNRPEFYLRALTVICITIVMLSVYATGKLIAKNTGNYITAFFFQLIVISGYLNVHYMIRICPEFLMVTILPYYCAFIWMLSYKKSQQAGFTISTRSILFLAFITAALFVAKITCVPFILVPLFFIEKPKKIILYIISMIVFALLILYPVWTHFNEMYVWFFSLATHTGVYGSGKEQIIDKAEYINHLKIIFNDEWFFTMGFILVSIFVLVGLFTQKWKNSFYKLTVAFWMVIVLLILMAAKHYTAHYLVPAQAITIPAVLAGFVVFSQFKLNNVVVVLLTLCAGFLLYKFEISATCYWTGNKQYKSSLEAKNKFGNMPKIMTTSYEESCFVESALSFGAAYGGDGFDYGRQYLLKKYPASFVYDKTANKLFYFLREVPFSDVFEKYPEVLVNFLRKDEAYRKEALNNITDEYEFAVKSVELAKTDTITGDDFYVIHIDTALAKPHYTQTVTINFDFEKTTNDKSNFLSVNDLNTCAGVNVNSKEKYISGNTSIKADAQNRYVGWTAFEIKQGDAVEITVNMFSEDEIGGIIISWSEDKGNEKSSQEVIADLGNGWKKIRLRTRVQKRYKIKIAAVTLFYFGTKVCYFDDLSIKVLKK